MPKTKKKKTISARASAKKKKSPPAKKKKASKAILKFGQPSEFRNLRFVETNPFIVWGSRPGTPDPTFWYIDFANPKPEQIVSPWVHLVFQCINDRVSESKIIDLARVKYNARLDHETLWHLISNMRQEGLLAIQTR